MADYKKLYYYLYAKVADVIEENKDTKKYEPIVKKLIDIELETEDMYMDMPDDEDEVTDDEDWV